MRRRTLLTTVVAVTVAGCSSFGADENGNVSESETGGDDNGDESATESDVDDGASESDTESDADDSDEVSQPAVLDGFVEELEERGFQGAELEEVDDGYALGYDATGGAEDDVAVEIELIADGYTTSIEDGLSSTHLEANAYEPDSGELLDYFTIETEWVDEYLSESLEWSELLARIAETFVSTQPSSVDEDDGDDGEGRTDGADEGDEDDAESE